MQREPIKNYENSNLGGEDNQKVMYTDEFLTLRAPSVDKQMKERINSRFLQKKTVISEFNTNLKTSKWAQTFHSASNQFLKLTLKFP